MQIYEEIAIKDVKLGTDVLRPVWEELNHYDGFVSLEVAPTFWRRSSRWSAVSLATTR